MRYLLSMQIKKRLKCPQCESFHTKKRGHQDGVQTYSCNDCKTRFRSSHRTPTIFINQLWYEYVFNKLTVRELVMRHGMDRRIIRSLLDQYQVPKKIHNPRSLHLIVDAVYFEERTELTSWCAVVARDPNKKENLWWGFADRENTSIYRQCRDDLEALGYQIISVTGDGFGGIKQAFSGIPYQMCLVHMERIVTRGTTLTPKTKAGEILLLLAHSLHKTKKNDFNRRLDEYFRRYKTFLNERTIHPDGTWSWTHEDLGLLPNSG